jgi:acetyl esterase/lipase
MVQELGGFIRMNIDLIAPELRKAYQYLPPVPLHDPRLRFLIRLMHRISGQSKLARGVRLGVQTIGQGGIRVYQPASGFSGAGVMWLHGGGFVVGSAVQDERFCSRLAQDLGLVVVSVDYRLAPEDPFPAALDDCFSAWEWIQENAPDLGIDPDRIALAGQSAGGGLAACLAQRILDNGGRQPAAQLLIYPMLDDHTAADRSLDGLVHPLWNNRNNRGGWKAYLGQEPGKPNLPDYAAASRRRNLAGLPPAWIGVGDIDLFYRENKEYADRLTAAGVDCDLEVVAMAPHGFDVVASQTSIAREFFAKFRLYLSRALGL